jgi:sarcosine oxidase delta subunit
MAFLAGCPFCGKENKVWLFKVKPDDMITRGANDR